MIATEQGVSLNGACVERRLLRKSRRILRPESRHRLPAGALVLAKIRSRRFASRVFACGAPGGRATRARQSGGRRRQENGRGARLRAPPPDDISAEHRVRQRARFGKSRSLRRFRATRTARKGVPDPSESLLRREARHGRLACSAAPTPRRRASGSPSHWSCPSHESPGTARGSADPIRSLKQQSVLRCARIRLGAKRLEQAADEIADCADAVGDRIAHGRGAVGHR